MQMIYQIISQGEKIDDKIRAQAIIMKDIYEKELYILLENNQELLTKIINALVKDTTIDQNQWTQLVC